MPAYAKYGKQRFFFRAKEFNARELDHSRVFRMLLAEAGQLKEAFLQKIKEHTPVRKQEDGGGAMKQKAEVWDLYISSWGISFKAGWRPSTMGLRGGKFYPPYVLHGTGIHGPKGKAYGPTNDKNNVLVWWYFRDEADPKSGMKVYAKEVEGQEPVPIFEEAVKDWKPHVDAAIANCLARYHAMLGVNARKR